MKPAVRLLAVVSLATMAGSGQAASPKRSCDTAIAVSDEAALRQLLRCAPAGSTVWLAANAQFGPIALNGVTAQSLTIRSQDPKRPARFAGLTLRNASGLSLRDIAFGGAVGNGQKALLAITGSSALRLESLSFTGDTTTFRPELEAAVTIRNSRDVTVSGLRIEGFRNGIAMRDSARLEVTHNSIRLMQTDGIRASGVQDLRIARNVIANFTPAPRDHPDGVQLWARTPAEVSQRVLIEDNLILRGSGNPIQGIFLRAVNNAPFRDVTIRNNLIVGQRWNGIAVMGADGADVSGNTILGMGRQLSWLRMVDCVNASASGNQAGRYVLAPAVRDGGNAIAGAQGNATGLVTQWRERLGLGPERYPE